MEDSFDQTEVAEAYPNLHIVHTTSIEDGVGCLRKFLCPANGPETAGTARTYDDVIKEIAALTNGGRNFIVGTDIDGVLTIKNEILKHLTCSIDSYPFARLQYLFHSLPNAITRFVITSRPALWGFWNWKEKISQLLSSDNSTEARPLPTLDLSKPQDIEINPLTFITDAGKDVLALVARIPTSLITGIRELKKTISNLTRKDGFPLLMGRIAENGLANCSPENTPVLIYFDNDDASIEVIREVAARYPELTVIYLSIRTESLLGFFQRNESLRALLTLHAGNVLRSLNIL